MAELAGFTGLHDILTTGGPWACAAALVFVNGSLRKMGTKLSTLDKTVSSHEVRISSIEKGSSHELAVR